MIVCYINVLLLLLLLLLLFHRRLFAECATQRIVKISRYLAKIWTRVSWHVLMVRSVVYSVGFVSAVCHVAAASLNSAIETVSF